MWLTIVLEWLASHRRKNTILFQREDEASQARTITGHYILNLSLKGLQMVRHQSGKFLIQGHWSSVSKEARIQRCLIRSLFSQAEEQ